MNSMIAKLGRTRQRGISLVTTLVMLVAVMVLGLSAILVSKSDFMLSGNLQFQSAALNEAEAAAVAAERWLAVNGGRNVTTNVPGFSTYSSATPHLYPLGSNIATAAMTMSWSDSNSKIPPDPDGTDPGNSTTQRYLIELLASDRTLIPTSLNVGGRQASGCNKVNVYRIIAQGGSARGASKFVQSIYSRLSCGSGSTS
ncbi:MAG: pilus assembly PilX family protein [Burkholderiales bacterium]